MAQCYPHQVQNYYAWFEQEQSQIAVDNPLQAVLPVFSVTAVKATVFLHHKYTYKKVCLASWMLATCGPIDTSFSSTAQA